MAQGDCKRSKKNKQSALSKYKGCPPEKKYLVWLYFRGDLTQGREGFKCEGVAPGGKDQYAICPHAVKTYYNSRAFRNVCKVSL